MQDFYKKISAYIKAKPIKAVEFFDYKNKKIKYNEDIKNSEGLKKLKRAQRSRKSFCANREVKRT